MLVDTHCHLDMLSDVPGALARMAEAGVDRCVTIGVDLASSEWAVECAASHDQVWATVGLHPHDAKDWTPELGARLASLAASPRVVGIGEAGLDYHYDNSPRDQQRDVFRAQIAIAHATGKALVIHSREAWDDTFDILVAEGVPARTVFHCFSGGPEEARRALALGAVLSFSGVVTFRNAGDLRAAAAVTPADRLVVETDAPFLTPVPHRGKPNEPAYVAFTASAIAEATGREASSVAQDAGAAAAALFAW
jgi:TatD DNase family protein